MIKKIYHWHRIWISWDDDISAGISCCSPFCLPQLFLHLILVHFSLLNLIIRSWSGIAGVPRWKDYWIWSSPWDSDPPLPGPSERWWNQHKQHSIHFCLDSRSCTQVSYVFILLYGWILVQFLFLKVKNFRNGILFLLNHQIKIE